MSPNEPKPATPKALSLLRVAGKDRKTIKKDIIRLGKVSQAYTRARTRSQGFELLRQALLELAGMG